MWEPPPAAPKAIRQPPGISRIVSAWRYLRKNPSLFDPCIEMWHVVHFWNLGSSMLCLEDCNVTPLLRVPNSAAPLWHSRHNVNTTGLRSSFAFIEPCGLWQVSHPSTPTRGGLVTTSPPRVTG